MKKFNIEEFFTFIVLLGFSTFIFYLLTTKKIYNFISPKMVIYIVFSFIVFTVLTFYQGNKIFSPKSNRPISKGHGILLLTLVIGFVAAEKGLNMSIITNKGVNLPNYVNSDKLKLPDAVKDNQGNSKDDLNSAKNKNKFFDEKTQAIIIEDDNFHSAVNELATNLDKYLGKKVIISGFVYRKQEYKEDEFVIGRMTMSCCAADAQVIGLMAKYEKAMKLEKDSWVKVEGIVGKGDYKEANTNSKLILPVVKVEKIEKIDTPDNIYVYPE